MPALTNKKHEAFAAFVASGQTAGKAYVAAGYHCKSSTVACASGHRLLGKAEVKQRVAELRPETEAKIVAAINVEVDRSCLEAVGRLEGYLRRKALIEQVIAERAVFEARDQLDKDGKPLDRLPGVGTGIVVTSYKGVGRGVVRTHEVDFKLLDELRQLDKQIAIERHQWQESEDARSGEDNMMKELADAIRNSPRE